MSAIRKGNVAFDFDTKIFLLKSAVRRELILVVAEYEDLTLREASEHIAAKKEGVDVDEITYHDQKGIFSMCSQNHCPALEEHGIVEIIENEVGATELRATDLTADVAELIDLFGDVQIGGARA